MKIAVSTENYEILNSIIRTAKEHESTVVIAKMEKQLFDHIDSEEIEAYIISSTREYAQKAVDFIKKFNPYIPVVIIAHGGKYSVNNADSVVPFEKENNTDLFAKAVLHNIYAYCKNFETLQRLTAKMGDIIEFGDCKFDPTKRILFRKGVQVFWDNKGKKAFKLSQKQAGIFELLAANFGQVVRKDIIMERVWHTNNNYFIGRSLDVFVTHLRKIIRDGGIKMTITNVSNVGLMLDWNPDKKK